MASCIMNMLLLLLLAHPIRAEFNFEVGRRIHERVSGFIKTPTLILSHIARYRDNQAFSHDMRAPDRDAFFRLNDAFMQTYPEFQSIYYGLEDGMFAGHGFASRIANYREPGHSGYLIDDETNLAVDGEMQKHYDGCMNGTSGEILPCEMSVGGKYTECINDCELVKCADELSQKDCSILTDANETIACEANIKWCTNYEIKESTNETRRGYVSRGTHCINDQGIPSETPGEIVKQGTEEKGGCFFGDGVTPVERGNITGDFGYCGDDGEVCNGTHVGSYISRDYDPRWRGWYIATKGLQVPNWSPPYPFFTAGQIGITFSLPIYSENDSDQNVFMGVLAVDFTFTDISNFLIDNYKGTDTTVIIFERDEPHYVVAASTGSTGVKRVLKSDGVTPCAADATRDECQAIRASAGELDETSADAIIRASFLNQQAAGFPQDDLISSAPDGYSDIYASQVKLFSTSTGSLGVTELNWQIMIMLPVTTEDSDTILYGDSLFGILVTVASIGALVCFALIGLLVKNRKKREVIVTDWRFLSAFLASCAMLNLACLSYLGPNTDELCLIREWLVHFFLVLSLSLLFTKTYRMYKLVDSASTFRSTIITHKQAVKLAAPLVLVQTLILLVFTFVDPSKLTELIYFSGSDITHRLICSHETPAFFITTVTFEGGLILVGCVLAFKTRNLRSEFNESKQIIFSMYDTAVISTIILVVSNIALQYQGQQRLLYSLGIFWITCFAGCVFVLPRTLKFSSRRSGAGNRSTMSQNSRADSIDAQPTGAQGFSVAAIRARSTNVSKASQDGYNRRISFDSNISEGPPIEHEKSPGSGLSRKTTDISSGSNKSVSFKPDPEVAVESPKDQTATTDVEKKVEEQNLTQASAVENEDMNVAAKRDEEQNLGVSNLTQTSPAINGDVDDKEQVIEKEDEENWIPI